ncbi:LOW QUALITY PROTEIN: hypothetical protein HID58_015416 [Brassica napus]|uniref:Uncharacterized protein n=1 Tax=Brassica napus TaxID=3708 RepID=A0ABQ8DK05_BRANA|nr:LOW QUALITY PROTEIN: hypothetical protein HID58_015416 [Brassica napus]
MCDVVVGALSRIHLDLLRGGLDPRLVALDWSISEAVGVWGDSESAFWCSDPDLSFAFICGVNGDCGGCCCGGLAPGLLVLFSEVYLASLWSGVPSFPKTETWRLVSVKGYVLCSGVMMAALPCQSVHVGYCGCVVIVSPWFALAIEVWRFRICRLWLLSSPSLVRVARVFVSGAFSIALFAVLRLYGVVVTAQCAGRSPLSAGADVHGLCLPLSQPFWPVSFWVRGPLDLPCAVVGLEFLMSDRVVSALEVARELFLVEPDHKEQIIGEAKITGFLFDVLKQTLG